ncbi:MAG: TerC family protein [Deinococcus sp.]|nr:TerC family protein [Deinococcus sp.]
MEWITSPEAWTALVTLLFLEVVLGVDNIIFISILASKLPKNQQHRARQLGIIAAAASRLLFLLGITWVIRLNTPLFSVLGQELTGKEIILILGGIFLIYKATSEIHDRLEGAEGSATVRVAPTFLSVIGQVMLLDIVFSIDSVITAVGMTPYVPVMMIAVILSVVVMLVSAKPIYDFITLHPTIKMLALAFLLLIGFTLIAEGLGQKIPKGYIYFAIAFSVFVETLNLRTRGRTEPVQLRQPHRDDPPSQQP